jgi:hypothetical protein
MDASTMKLVKKFDIKSRQFNAVETWTIVSYAENMIVSVL